MTQYIIILQSNDNKPTPEYKELSRLNKILSMFNMNKLKCCNPSVINQKLWFARQETADRNGRARARRRNFKVI